MTAPRPGDVPASGLQRAGWPMGSGSAGSGQPGQARSFGRPDDLPDWWEPLLTRASNARTEDFTTLRPPVGRGRASAVLVLLGEDRPGQPDLLVLQRAATMENEKGKQPLSFPRSQVS